MAAKKLLANLVLVGSIGCLLVALGGAGMQFLKKQEKPPAVLPPPRVAKEVPVKVEVPVVKPDPPVEEPRVLSDAERRKALKEVLLKRIAATTAKLDSQWLSGVFQYIRDETALQAYYEEFLTLGAQQAVAYEAQQKSAKKVVTGDPRFFLSLARKVIYAAKPSARGLDQECKGNIALALFKEKEAKKGLEQADGTFMMAFFKELAVMYRHRRQLALQAGEDPQAWLVEQIKGFEAAAMDPYLRIGRYENMIKEKRTGAQISAAPDLLRVDNLKKFLDESLLNLGKLYVEAAAQESKDRERLQVYADRAFVLLGMVYQRTQSGEALKGLLEINDIQQNYLLQMGKAAWKLAQLAVENKDQAGAVEHYFRATQYYNESMVKAVGEEREEIAGEFLRLKQEIAAWHAQKAPPAKGGKTGI